MAEYTVTLAGLSAGTDMDKAAAECARAFKVDEAKARALIEGSKRIGNGVSRKRAEKHLEVLGRIGVEANVAPPLETEVVVGDDDVDESAQTIIQVPGQGLAPIADPDAGADPPEEVGDNLEENVDQNAATVMMAVLIADPDAPAAEPAPSEYGVDQNAATVIAAVPIVDSDAAADADIDPNAARLLLRYRSQFPIQRRSPTLSRNPTLSQSPNLNVKDCLPGLCLFLAADHGRCGNPDAGRLVSFR